MNVELRQPLLFFGMPSFLSQSRNGFTHCLQNNTFTDPFIKIWWRPGNFFKTLHQTFVRLKEFSIHQFFKEIVDNKSEDGLELPHGRRVQCAPQTAKCINTSPIKQ